VNNKTLHFTATVQKVQTLEDHGLRVTLDLSEQQIKEAAILMECRRAGFVLQLVATVCKTEKRTEEKQDDTVGKRSIRQPKGQT
jgi:hypothetical protein